MNGIPGPIKGNLGVFPLKTIMPTGVRNGYFEKEHKRVKRATPTWLTSDSLLIGPAGVRTIKV